MFKTITTASLVAAITTGVHAASFSWDDGATPGLGPHSVFTAGNWTDDNPPVNAGGNTVSIDVGDNEQRQFDINNGGANFDMGATDHITIGRGNFIDSAGADDAFIGGEIRVNGAGGSAPIFDVAVIANQISSDRHGAIFNAATTIGSINSEGGHQQKWEFNAAPTAAINSIRMADTDGRGFGHDDNFGVNVDMSALAFDLEWGQVTVGGGSTFDVGALQITFDADWEGGNGGGGVNNQIVLNGDMTANSLTFENINVANDVSLASQATGTYGRIGLGGVDHNVDWITGDGVLAVVPEPGSIALLGIGGLLIARRRR